MVGSLYHGRALDGLRSNYNNNEKGIPLETLGKSYEPVRRSHGTRATTASQPILEQYKYYKSCGTET